MRALGGELRGGPDPETAEVLAGAAAKGAAFPHAGLASGHRELVGAAFRDRLIKCVCSPPPRASGSHTRT